MLRWLNTFLTGSEYPLKANFIDKLQQRNRFAPFLPYRTYDDTMQMFHNVDDTWGMMFECQPLVYASQTVLNYLENLLNQAFEDDTILQFILYADPNIEHILERHRELKTDHNELSYNAANATIKFLSKGTKGLDKLKGIPIRNFRLFVAIKSKKNPVLDEFKDDCNTTFEALRGAELAPRVMGPEELINVLAKMLNTELPFIRYNDQEFINEQILTADTHFAPHFDHLEVGKYTWRCLSVKKFPEYIDELTFNFLTGDIEGVTGDNNQIITPFIFCVNIIFQDVAKTLHTKCNIALQQKFVGSWATKLQNMQQEYMWATGQIEKQTKFVKVMPMIWHWSENPKTSEKCQARIKKIWGGRSKFIVQADKGILLPMFLSSLPFGLYTDKNNVDFLNRHFTCHSRIATRCLPIQADFKGGGEPVALAVGRKGQLVNLDLFAKQARNYNAVVAATSGAGKSFFLGNILWNYSTNGAKLRIIDLGGSYKKMCKIRGGKFLQFDRNTEISLNPFTYIVDFEEAKKTLAIIIAQMVYSATSTPPIEEEMTLIKSAIQSVWETYGNEGDIDKVYDILSNPKYIDELYQFDCGEESCLGDLKKISTRLAFNLSAFCSNGEYGRWYRGPATLNFEKEDMVVLELDELKAIPELFRVIVLQLVDMMTNEMYIGKSRGVKKIVVFEESWIYFEQNSKASRKEIEYFARIINEGYRRARKYGGSFITVVQSLLDFLAFGDIAQAILSNSDYKFLLLSQDFNKAYKNQLIDYGDFGLHILNTINSPKPNYSEIFADTPVGTGPIRMVVDQYMYFLQTTEAGEVAQIEADVKLGMTYHEAIEKMIANKE